MAKQRKINPLTPREQAGVEEQSYQGWLDRQAIYHPPPEASTSDLVTDNRRVMNVLIGAVGWLPLILAIVGLGAAVVSMDKTAAAFEASVAHKNGLFGAWTYIVALSAVVMTDLALVVGEFALVRDMLRKGLRRQVWNLAGLVRAIKVRIGIERPLGYHEMPDQALQFYVHFLFVLVIAANVYGVMRAGNIQGPADLNFENGLFLFVGVAGALSLRFLGQQLARIVYDMAAEVRELRERELREQWQADMLALWAQEGPAIIARALHEKYLRKNGLPLDTPASPYLLLAGQDEEGAPQITATPLAQSWMEWPNESPPNSRNNGRQEGRMNT